MTANEFSLPDGFSLRPAEMADAMAVISVINTAGLKYTGSPEYDQETLLSHWQNPKLDLAYSTRVICAADGRIVAYADISDGIVPVQPYLFGRVHPDYENRGLGSALLDWGEQRARDVFTRLPEDVQVSLLTSTVDSNQAAQELMCSRGMTHTHDFWNMNVSFTAEPAPPDWPPGITVTTFAQHPDLTALAEAHDNAFQDHWGYVRQPLADRLTRWQDNIASDPTHDPTLWFLAMDEDTLAGYCLCRSRAYDDAEMGYVKILGVTRPYRQRGLGLALLQHSFRQLYQRGQKGVSLGVDADSLTGATRLYEKAGMTVHRRYLEFSKLLRPGRDITTQSAAT
ncbi:MAG TPA: GNAT family N-acetyltransferase [Anaerolineae bacterium]|nr:GNAT family N-acetyltransferase [Anaerolineae bacterium]